MLYVLGNCVDLATEDEDFLPRIDTTDGLEDEDEPVVAAGVTSVVVRGQAVPVSHPAGTDLIEVFRSLTRGTGTCS